MSLLRYPGSCGDPSGDSRDSGSPLHGCIVQRLEWEGERWKQEPYAFSDSNEGIFEMLRGENKRSCFLLFQKLLMSCGALQPWHWALLHHWALPVIHSLKRVRKHPGSARSQKCLEKPARAAVLISHPCAARELPALVAPPA